MIGEAGAGNRPAELCAYVLLGRIFQLIGETDSAYIADVAGTTLGYMRMLGRDDGNESSNAAWNALNVVHNLALSGNGNL